jgi:hypothetical protein
LANTAINQPSHKLPNNDDDDDDDAYLCRCKVLFKLIECFFKLLLIEIMLVLSILLFTVRSIIQGLQALYRTNEWNREKRMGQIDKWPMEKKTA